MTQDRRTFEDQRQTVERELGQQADKVTAMTLAVREDRRMAAEARMEAQEAVREVKALRAHLRTLLSHLARWLRRDDLTEDARQSCLRIQA